MKGLLLMLAAVWLALSPVRAQGPIVQAYNDLCVTTLRNVANPYFKTLPYGKNFSDFLKEVINDPDLVAKTVNRRTDTSFFYISGTYRHFNSFIYRPTTLRMIVAESEFSDSDTSSYRDTVVYCQLVVIADSTDRAAQFVQKEYNRLLRKLDKKFTFETRPLAATNKASQGAATTCFIDPFAVSPLTVAWGQSESSHAYIFSLTLGMKVRGNKAGMITLPQEPIMLSKAPEVPATN